jgi:hypothetical protein
VRLLHAPGGGSHPTLARGFTTTRKREWT